MTHTINDYFRRAKSSVGSYALQYKGFVDSTMHKKIMKLFETHLYDFNSIDNELGLVSGVSQYHIHHYLSYQVMAGYEIPSFAYPIQGS